MKKLDKRAERFLMECPFCGFLCDYTSPLMWCSGCYCEWYENKNGDYVFDSPRFPVRHSRISVYRPGNSTVRVSSL